MKNLVYMILGLLMLVSCNVTREIVEVPIETIKTEYIHNTIIDSIYVKDSIDRWRNGDTVFIYKEHTKFKYLSKVDTVVRIDSIPKVIEIKTKEVVEVNRLKWYQKTLMWIGGIVSLMLTGYIIFKIKF